jgi:hypothetical protein
MEYNPNYIKTLPKEVFQEILLLLAPYSIIWICQSSKYVSDICDDHKFWITYISTKFKGELMISGYSSCYEMIVDIGSWKKVIYTLHKNKSFINRKIIISGTNFYNTSLITISEIDTLKALSDRISRYLKLNNYTGEKYEVGIHAEDDYSIYYEYEGTIKLKDNLVVRNLYPDTFLCRIPLERKRLPHLYGKRTTFYQELEAYGVIHVQFA